MKKLILVFATIAIAVCAYTQTDSTNKKMPSQDISNQDQNVQNNPVGKSHPDGVMMQNGKMMMVKNGQSTILDHDMTMSNGTKILSDGTFIKKDGTKMTMKEGQHVDMSGNMVSMKTEKVKSMNPVPDNTVPDNTVPGNSVPDNSVPDNSVPGNSVPDNSVPDNTKN